ncbi:hypothetical protein OSG_eHP7_00130 [environmental Halophage eHP-7]|jgi:hypothetical protein|nr:hypothetical protein OSG_eHP7_00130 [environmental Halophage eHP-7]
MSLPTTADKTMIEGSEFRKLLERTDLSRRQVAERLGTSHTNLNNKCKPDAEVSALYEYAVRWLLQQEEK